MTREENLKKYEKPTVTELGRIQDFVQASFDSTVPDGVVIPFPGGGMVVQTEEMS